MGRVATINLIALLAFAAPGLADDPGRSIAGVESSGNTLFSDREVIETLGWEEGGEWSAAVESTGVAALLERYAERGYLDAEATVRTSAEGEEALRIELAVREGGYLPLRRLEIDGATLMDSAEIHRRFESRPGSPIDPRRIERDAEDLLLWYARRGHPFGRLLLTDVTEESDPRGFGLSLLLVEGPDLVLGDIAVSGNETTRLSTVRRLSGLRFDEPYDQVAVDDSRERLLRSGLFRSVEAPVTRVEWTEKKAVVQYEMEEARANRIEGVLGYAPGDGEEDGILSGFVNLLFRNILGTARRAEILWEQSAPGSRRVRLAYREPWLFGSPFAVGGSVEQTLRDSSWARSSGALEVDVAAGRRVGTRFAVGAESMKPRDEKSGVPRSVRRWGSVGITFDGRDHPLNPRRGLFIRFDPEYGERSIEEEEERDITKEKVRQATIDASLGLFRSIGQSVVLSAEVQGRAKFTNAPFVPFYDQFYLGGANSLRGYEEDRFLGSRIGWSRLEIRRLIGRLSRVFLFSDTGYIFSRRDDEGEIISREEWKRSFGVGLRVESGIGIIGIDYGLGEGDSFQEGKVHVSASGEF